MPGLQADKIKGVADIVIAVDCTGSMANCIGELKEQLRSFINELQKPSASTQRSVDWRLKVFGFRDLNADTEPWINLDGPMVARVEEAQAQVDLLVHTGGGDLPESHLDALWYAATKTSWRPSCTKVVILFSDAPALDALHPSTVAAGAVGGDVSTVAQALAERNLYLYAWAAPCPAMETISRTMKVVYTPMLNDSGLKTLDFTKLLMTLAKTVSAIASEPVVGGGGTVPLD